MSRVDLAFPKPTRKPSKKRRDAAKAAAHLRTKPCARCGQSLAPRKPSALHRRRFCSRVCSDAWVRERNPQRAACVVCGKSTVSGRIPGKTCSAACGYLLRKSKLRSAKKCDHCGAEYWPGGRNGIRFCSRKCHFASKSARPALLHKTCEVCGAGFRRTRAAVARTNRSFCSNACSHQFNRGANSPMFRGDKDPNRGAEWNRLAASIRARDGYSCRRCGVCETGNGQKLSVDHIRPWRSFDDKAQANHPTNLVSLCRPCHSFKTTTVERAWLSGDVIAFKQWVRSLFVESAQWSGHQAYVSSRGRDMEPQPQSGLFSEAS